VASSRRYATKTVQTRKGHERLHNGILIWLRNYNERLKYDPIETLGKPFESHPNWRIERQILSRCIVEVIFDVSDDSDTIYILEVNFSE